jgi:hypothetical protein
MSRAYAPPTLRPGPTATDRRAAVPVAGFGIGVRALRAGEAFVAVRTERRDGHDFLSAARAQGAAGALVARRSTIRCRSSWLDDPLGALRRIAARAARPSRRRHRDHRQRRQDVDEGAARRAVRREWFRDRRPTSTTPSACRSCCCAPTRSATVSR